MKHSKPLSSNRIPAVAAGLAILIMALAAGFSLAYVLNSLFVEDSPSQTLINAKASSGLFRAGIGGWLLIFVSDIVAAWGLHLFFSKSKPGLSLLTAWLRLSYTLILGIAIASLVGALSWHSNISASLDVSLLETQTFNAIVNFHSIWSLGLIVFGLHLLALGWLSLRSELVPKWISYLLLVAGVAYFGLNGMDLLFPELESVKNTAETILGLPMAVSELALAGWLLWKGGKK